MYQCYATLRNLSFFWNYFYKRLRGMYGHNARDSIWGDTQRMQLLSAFCSVTHEQGVTLSNAELDALMKIAMPKSKSCHA